MCSVICWVYGWFNVEYGGCMWILFCLKVCEVNSKFMLEIGYDCMLFFLLGGDEECGWKFFMSWVFKYGEEEERENWGRMFFM